jgi:hypothetical protein
LKLLKYFIIKNQKLLIKNQLIMFFEIVALCFMIYYLYRENYDLFISLFVIGCYMLVAFIMLWLLLLFLNIAVFILWHLANIISYIFTGFEFLPFEILDYPGWMAVEQIQ